ncbi:MAG: hypothetical protein ACREC0_00600 [Methylocella sp.]
MAKEKEIILTPHTLSWGARVSLEGSLRHAFLAAVASKATASTRHRSGALFLRRHSGRRQCASP